MIILGISRSVIFLEAISALVLNLRLFCMFDQRYDLVDTSDILDATFLNSLWLYAKTLFSQINLTIFASQRQNVNS